MNDKICINLILPLKIEWNPTYYANKSDVQSGKIAEGTRVKVRFAGKFYTAVVEKIDVRTDIPQNKIQDIISVEDNLVPITPQEIELWRFVSDYYMCSIGEVYKAAYPVSKISDEKISAKRKEREEQKAQRLEEVLKQKKEKIYGKIEAIELKLSKAVKDTVISNLTERKQKLLAELQELSLSKSEHSCEKETQTPDLAEIHLNKAQEKALKEIQEGFNKAKTVLLNGITGSGKTEIYLSLANKALREGKNVLYLVPEIALSLQLEERLKRIFGDKVLSFHSKESVSQRRKVAEITRIGNYVILGTRSSIFLPHNKLGLIIVDEEHDLSYKQDSPAPRYNGRDTAIMLGKIHGADVILGSATPSLEALYNCEANNYHYVRLSEKYYGNTSAEVVIIDTIAERKKRGMVGNLSKKLIQYINNALSKKEQVLILRGRRAYSSAVQCNSCGDIPKCPHCNVSLSYHISDNRLVCHYCGYRTNFVSKCGKCGGELIPIGSGTQRIEEEVRQMFPEAKISRLDSDVAQNKNKEVEIIENFSKGKTDILIGTQIITKGFDFDNLSLVAVINSDSILGQQDFRADERALQLLEQFKGRSGRREKDGIFVIQTSLPEHPVYKQLISAPENNSNFVGSMLDERRMFNYPPFSRLINIILKDKNQGRLNKLSYELKVCLEQVHIPGIKTGSETITGPFTPLVDKIADEFILHIRINLPRNKSLFKNKLLIGRTIAKFEKDRQWSGHITVDVDPS